MGIHWFLIIAFVFVYVQGKVYRKWGLRHIEYTRRFNVRHCVEGDEVRLVEQVANRKLLPLPWLRLESAVSAHLKFRQEMDMDIRSGQRVQNHKSFFTLLPYMKITRSHKVTCLKRGCYDLNSAAITCGDPLGMNKTTRKVELQVRLYVYPKPWPLEDLPLPSHSWQGDITVKRWIIDDPFIISGVREYRYGDPLNGINWKATARSGKLQVHNRDYTADHRLTIYLNVELDEHMWREVTDPELIEKGIRYAAAIAESAISQGIETGFGCNGHLVDERNDIPVRVDPYNGEGHLNVLYETMAKLAVDVRSVSFVPFLEQDVLEGCSNRDYVLITPYVSETMEQMIEQLVYNGNAVKVIELKHGSLGSQTMPNGERGLQQDLEQLVRREGTAG